MSGLKPEVLRFAHLLNQRLLEMEACGDQPYYRNDTAVGAWLHYGEGVMDLIGDTFDDLGSTPWLVEPDEWRETIGSAAVALLDLALKSGLIGTIPNEPLISVLERGGWCGTPPRPRKSWAELKELG